MTNILFAKAIKPSYKNVIIAGIINVFLLLYIFNSLYSERGKEVNAAALEQFGFLLSHLIFYWEIISSGNYITPMVQSILGVFIPILISLQISDKLRKEPHMGWRRIYFILPVLAALIMFAYWLMKGDGSWRNVAFSMLCAMVMAAIISVLLNLFAWVKDGFKAA
jgi:hypothetical protein